MEFINQERRVGRRIEEEQQTTLIILSILFIRKWFHLELVSLDLHGLQYIDFIKHCSSKKTSNTLQLSFFFVAFPDMKSVRTAGHSTCSLYVYGTRSEILHVH